MKKFLSAAATAILTISMLQIPAAAAGTSLENAFSSMKAPLILLFVILAALVASCVLFTITKINADRRAARSRRRRKNRTFPILLTLMYTATGIVLVCTVFCAIRYNAVAQELSAQTTPPVIDSTPAESTSTTVETTPVATIETTIPTVPTEPDPTYTPEYLELSNPDNWGITWEIIDHGAIVDTYQRPESISFGKPEDYFALPGIATFRGNNYRNGASYGTADITNETITKKWGANIGSLNGWPGSGWTGQPLVVRWDEETKAIMNLYDSKKNKADLVEVIYATLDGYIYFYDLDDGSYTRNPIWVGMNFKGAGSLDPRGYPLMYVGSGDYIGNTAPRMYVISLVDGSILYEKSGYDAFAQRSWVAFDSSPLVDAETDTLIWPGESGILYTIKLNTDYDKAAGTLSVAPEEVVKTRYTTQRSLSGNYWIGFEPSAVIVDRYLYISENGGMFFCIDLDTMDLVWAQDTRDDSNSTPVFEWGEDGNGYLYTAPSLHWTARDGSGYISIYKLNAKTGEIVWELPIDCYTITDLSGGVQSTPLLGKEGTELEGLILYSVARTPSWGDGKLIAVDTDTGEIVWEKYMDNYTWSSPLGIYTDDGTAYIVLCDSIGQLKLLNAKGEVLDSLALGSNIEASPLAFENTVITGTRGGQIFGLELS